MSHPDLVENAEIFWHRGMDSVQEFARSSGLFREVDVAQNTGDTREFSEFNLEEYGSVKGESDQAARARVQQGYRKTGRLYRTGADITISYEMRTRNKYQDVIAQLTNLPKMGVARLDLDLTHRLTFGLSTSYTDKDGNSIDVTVGDGLALFSTAHTLRGSSTTFRNRLAGNPAFTRSALESMELMRVENTFNQFGEKMSIPDDIIWATDDPNTNNSIDELLRSTATTTVDQNSGVVNVYSGKYRKVTLPRLATTATGGIDTSKRKYWGVASSMMTQAYLGMHEEVRMKVGPAEGKGNEEFATDDWSFGYRAGYMICIVSAAWIGFSSGDGTA